MMDYIRSVLTLIFATSIMYMLLDCEIKTKRKRYLMVLYIAIVLICDGFVLYQLGYPKFMKLYPVTVHLPVCIGFMFVSKFKPIQVFFVHLTLVAITMSFSLLGLMVSYLLGSNRDIVNIFSYIVYLPAGLLIYKYIRPPFLSMLRHADKGWLAFCIIPLSYSLLIYSTGTFNIEMMVPESILDPLLFFILAFSSYFLIFRFFVQAREQFTLQNEQHLLVTQVAAAQIHFEALEESQEKTMLYRHDMRHHLNLINSYLEDNNKEAAQRYLTEVEKTIEGAAIERYCNNYTVNLILSSYIEKAKRAQIHIETQIDLPEKATVSDMDLCVIFANAIENAVNACMAIENTNERSIKITCKTKNHQIFIYITNTYTGTILFVDNLPICIEENHGLGTKSITAIAQKYGGIYSFSAEDNLFKTSIVL